MVSAVVEAPKLAAGRAKIFSEAKRPDCLTELGDLVQEIHQGSRKNCPFGGHQTIR